jgi:hypothetical protein
MKSLIKRVVIWGYCQGWMSADRVGSIFKKYKLGSV